MELTNRRAKKIPNNEMYTVASERIELRKEEVARK